MKKKYNDDLYLSLNPEEKLRMENQLLELKLKAEFGAETYSEGEIPAAVENEFLRNVLEFEKNFSISAQSKIYDILGNPITKPESELNDQEVELFLNEVNEMLLKANITVDFGGSYDNRTKYKFITEELFEECIFRTGIPGMMVHFIYEEFHPDHKVDLENKAQKFMTAWFDKDVDKLLWELSDRIILPQGSTLSKEQVKDRLQNVLERYTLFSESKFLVSDISFEVNDDAGMGLAEGIVSYNALMQNNEAIAIQGPFRLYFCLEYGWWDICYFVLPGFEFNGNENLDSAEANIEALE